MGQNCSDRFIWIVSTKAMAAPTPTVGCPKGCRAIALTLFPFDSLQTGKHAVDPHSCFSNF
ncbi:hypothetical protein GS682_02655 [Nostoc sp. B(2019)]|nr:hypothetical protein [Nostoc sp. B(2019)]